MSTEAQIDEFTSEVITDFKATSDNVFDARIFPIPGLQIDTTLVLGAIVKALVEQIVGWAKKRFDNRSEKTNPTLTENDIREIRDLVLRFAARAKDSTGEKALTPELAMKMADSIERVVRRNPNLLLGNSLKGK